MGDAALKSRRALFIVITDRAGGAERVSFSVATELARRRWTVEVVIVCAALRNSFSKQALPPEIRVRYGPFRNRFLALPLLPLRLLRTRYDLVFTSQIYTNAIVSVLRRFLLMRADRLITRESMSLFDRFSGAKSALFRLLYRCYGGEDLLIAQTCYMAEHVRPRLPAESRGHVRVLENPVDLAAIDELSAEPLEPELQERLARRRNILFCGRFVDFKRPLLALEVFRMLKESGAEEQLVFMGSGPLERRVQEQAREWGLSPDVLFLGQRTNPFSVMAACQFGLLTSANEGFPNVVLEMMASRMKGIIMTPCAGDLKALPGVTVTRTHGAGDIADAMAAMLRSPADLGSQYRSAVERRAVGHFVDRLIGDAPEPKSAAA